MGTRNFRELLEARWAAGHFVCVGLDSDYDQLPEGIRSRCRGKAPAIVQFNRAIVEATRHLVCAYKPNAAFYEAYGTEGIEALGVTVATINELAPEVPTILDAKRADIGSTNKGYVRAIFERWGFDAVTVHPWLGREALQPFLDQKDKGIFVLCRTSNPGAGEFQDQQVVYNISETTGRQYTRPLFKIVAERVARNWNQNGNCGLVVGATAPAELADVRKTVGDMPILIPGIGAQGGDVEATVKAGKDSRGRGMIINSSRGIIFASKGEDFAQAARRETEKLAALINQHR